MISKQYTKASIKNIDPKTFISKTTKYFCVKFCSKIGGGLIYNSSNFYAKSQRFQKVLLTHILHPLFCSLFVIKLNQNLDHHPLCSIISATRIVMVSYNDIIAFRTASDSKISFTNVQSRPFASFPLKSHFFSK